MTQTFTFEALPDGSANVYKAGRYIGNVANAADMGLYCQHENQTKISSEDETFFYCVDCGRTTK